MVRFVAGTVRRTWMNTSSRAATLMLASVAAVLLLLAVLVQRMANGVNGFADLGASSAPATPHVRDFLDLLPAWVQWSLPATIGTMFLVLGGFVFSHWRTDSGDVIRAARRRRIQRRVLRLAATIRLNLKEITMHRSPASVLTTPATGTDDSSKQYARNSHRRPFDWYRLGWIAVATTLLAVVAYKFGPRVVQSAENAVSTLRNPLVSFVVAVVAVVLFVALPFAVWSLYRASDAGDPVASTYTEVLFPSAVPMAISLPATSHPRGSRFVSHGNYGRNAYANVAYAHSRA